MKYPKYKLAFPGKHAIVFNGHPMTQFDGYTLGTYASGNGIVSANKTKGFWGESAELFQSAADYYTFAGYSANKGTINGNTYVFGKGNDIVTAFFNDTVIYNLFLNQTQGGTITGNPMTGHSGQYIVLSALPSSHYTFNEYSVTGGVLSGDKIIIGNSDMTAQASWIEDPKYILTIQQTNGGIVSSNKSTGYQGDQVTLYNTPSSHYTFGSYNITGATLTGDKFNFVNQNVTANGTFIQDPIRNVTLQQTSGGTIYSDKSSGYDGDLVVLTNSPSAGYSLSSYNITGAELTGNRFNLSGSDVTAKGNFTPPDPYNPLGLPPYTIRIKYADGASPIYNKGNAIQVSQNPNVWDITYANNDWSDMFHNLNDSLLAVLGANTNGVTNMRAMFAYCRAMTATTLFDTSRVWDFRDMFTTCKITTVPHYNTSNGVYFSFFLGTCSKLTSVPQFDFSNAELLDDTFEYCPLVTSFPDFNAPKATTTRGMFKYCASLKYAPQINLSRVNNTCNMFAYCGSLTSTPVYNISNVTSMSAMYSECNSLTSVPLLDTTNVTNMASAFWDCYKVQSGASALYNQAKNQITKVTYHGGAFRNCGRDTAHGSAELATIASTWK